LSDGVVIAMKSASGLFFGGIYRKFLAIANKLAESPLSLRPNLPTVLARGSCHESLVIAKLEKIFLRSLNVSLPRATLVAWWKQSHCNSCHKFCKHSFAKFYDNNSFA
jgi:hypothetical protein